MSGRIWADASAALGIVGRQGLGKVRHLDTNVLWVQEAALRKQLIYCKVKGEHNIADLMTKYLVIPWTDMQLLWVLFFPTTDLLSLLVLILCIGMISCPAAR